MRRVLHEGFPLWTDYEWGIARESGYPDPVLREFCEKILFSGSTKPEAPMDRVMRCSDQVMGRDRE